MLILLDHPDKMNSISPECQELKEKYDACFNKWFSEKFLKGNTKDECSGLFEVYQECVKKAVKDHKIDLWELEKPVLGTDKEKKDPS